MSVIELAHRAVGRAVSGTPVWDMDDWDVLCVLDGCRVDIFRERYPGARAYWSVAAASPNWIRRTLGSPPPGVAYVTGNPFINCADLDALAYAHQERVRDVNGVETVPPKALADHARAVWANRDEIGVERVIVHFMQPHVPFRARPEWFKSFYGTETWGSRAWRRVARGDIDRTAWFDAYRDNLYWALSDGVGPIMSGVDGRVGITADHGNAAGEWGISGHPSNVAVPCVRQVPWWATRGGGGGGDADLPTPRLPDADARDGQLRALGYL